MDDVLTFRADKCTLEINYKMFLEKATFSKCKKLFKLVGQYKVLNFKEIEALYDLIPKMVADKKSKWSVASTA